MYFNLSSEMEFEEEALLILLWLLLQRKQRRRRKRTFWIHPIIENKSESQFQQLYDSLWLYEDKFFNYFRMSINTFDYLVSELREGIQKKKTLMQKSIFPERMSDNYDKVSEMLHNNFIFIQIIKYMLIKNKSKPWDVRISSNTKWMKY